MFLFGSSKNTLFLVVLICLLVIPNLELHSQSFSKQLQDKKDYRFEQKVLHNPFKSLLDHVNRRDQFKDRDQVYVKLNSNFTERLLTDNEPLIRVSLPLTSNESVIAHLEEVKILTPEISVLNSYGEEISLPTYGKFFWGYIKGDSESVAILNVFDNRISGTIQFKGVSYTLAKLKNENAHIFYKEESLVEQPSLECFADVLKENVEVDMAYTQQRNPVGESNCVRLYFEIDFDLFQSFGNIADAYSYLAGAFSQVVMLYANENIDMTLNQVKVWDTPDPYTGPSTFDFYTQFRAAVGSNYNGDLAHLVGTGGGGGIARVNALCSKAVAFAYSGINTSYNNVPSYSWTINVLTHEIGHNLGSPHTHACSWSVGGESNVQIDDCGNQVIEEPGICYDADNPIIPQNGGTIMSYCHLNNVGMNFNLGFGQQPGDLIRSRVYNASCLSICEDCTDFGNPCDDGDPCTVDDVYDSYCNCIGVASPDNDYDGICAELDPDDSDICIPNTCIDCTITTISIITDNYPAETSWEIREEGGTLVASGAGYASGSEPQNREVCLSDGCYDFTIFDSYGDGICCAYGNGSYVVTDAEGTVLASGGSFTSSESTSFCYNNTSGCVEGSSCDDGNICTVNDVYDASCNCLGVEVDTDGDGVCDEEDPCHDPMMVEMSGNIPSGIYNARSEILLKQDSNVPANAVIIFNSPTVRFMRNLNIPESATITINEQPCVE